MALDVHIIKFIDIHFAYLFSGHQIMWNYLQPGLPRTPLHDLTMLCKIPWLTGKWTIPIPNLLSMFLVSWILGSRIIRWKLQWRNFVINGVQHWIVGDCNSGPMKLSSFAAAVGLCCIHNAMICCFLKNKVISAAMCLIAANIFEIVGYPSNTVQ